MTLALGISGGLLGVCGPFTDVSDPAFCPFILEIFTLGITTGTTATTYDPSGKVTRIQMAAFLSRTVDTTLKRATRRVAVNQLATPRNTFALGLTSVGSSPTLVQFDGADLWVTRSGLTERVRASDGRLLETWPEGSNGGLLVAMKRVFLTDVSLGGVLYRIDPSQPPGAVAAVASNLPDPAGIAFDGERFWIANLDGSVSIVTPGPTIPWTATTVTYASTAGMEGALFDGNNVWVTLTGANLVRKLNSAGVVLQTVTVGEGPLAPVFDGANLWVPGLFDNTVSVVRASNGSVLQTLSGNGLNEPTTAAFDGERILVSNFGGDRVSLWKAADLTPLGSVPTGVNSLPYGACSDGTRFWIALAGAGRLARF